jgi:hypothetical protein
MPDLPDLVQIRAVTLLPGYSPAESHVHLMYIDQSNEQTALKIPFLVAMQLLQELKRVRSTSGFELPNCDRS